MSDKLRKTFQCTVTATDNITIHPYSNSQNLLRMDVIVKEQGSTRIVCLSREDALEFAACIFDIFDAPMSAATARAAKGKDNGT